MGDARLNLDQLKEEPYRVNTFGENSNIPAKNDLAKAGFYFTQIAQKVRCAECGLEVDTSRVRSMEEVFNLHKEKFPHCHYTASQQLSRTKKFSSYDSLRFEQERLETFIEWPITWLSPAELAKDGFYYLRTSDHCACVFCRGIVGTWEKGDIPREEHRRHFPHCPFIKGQPVGNIPLAHSSIISRISPTPEVSPTLPLSMDVCGTGKPMLGSYPESSPPKKDLMYEGIGLPQHSGPKRKEYLSQLEREKSFTNWPEKVKQTPKQLAEAGFFYCGLSDHVRCFHCGNGLRNWEKDDNPWEEHARWYPECTYILLKKGQEFIDTVRREKPPYLQSRSVNRSSSTTKPQTNITEQELNSLMELDIVKATLAMGFPQDKVRISLRRKLEQTGVPFFRLESCIEAVLQYMEEESRLALQQSSSVSVEAETQQRSKMNALQSSANEATTSNSNTIARISNTTASSSASTSSSASSSSLSSLSPGPSSRPDPELPSPPEPMETESIPVSPTDDVLSQADQVIGMAEQALNAAPTSPSSPTPNTSSVVSEASTPTTPPSNTALPASSSLSVSSSQSTDITGRMAKTDASNSSQLCTSGKPQTSQELAAELEKIKDSHMCKVCMDAEMNMVFLPCAHMVTCASCAVALTHCPICRKDIKYAIKPILS